MFIFILLYIWEYNVISISKNSDNAKNNAGRAFEVDFVLRFLYLTFSDSLLESINLPIPFPVSCHSPAVHWRCLLDCKKKRLPTGSLLLYHNELNLLFHLDKPSIKSIAHHIRL